MLFADLFGIPMSDNA